MHVVTLRFPRGTPMAVRCSCGTPSPVQSRRSGNRPSTNGFALAPNLKAVTPVFSGSLEWQDRTTVNATSELHKLEEAVAWPSSSIAPM